jgi:hypothetical protein
MSMVQIQHSQDVNDINIPKEVFLSRAPLQGRTQEIKEHIRVLLDDTMKGDFSRLETILAQIAPTKMPELELMAQVIVTKALDEPQHCKACVSLAGALQILLPALPSGHHGKGERFMHALLDVFQTEFEAACMGPAGETSPNEEEQIGSTRSSTAIWAEQRTQHRIRAIVHLAGHLHCHGLLGNGVVSQMVHDLTDNKESEAANELLWFIGIAANSKEQQRQQRQQQLGTVLEDVGDSDGTSSEARTVTA